MLFQIYGETAGFQLLGWLLVFVGLIVANEIARRTKWGGIACFLILPAVTWCDNCKQEYETVAHGKICPYCGSEKTWLLKGNELNIKEVEVI